VDPQLTLGINVKHNFKLTLYGTMAMLIVTPAAAAQTIEGNWPYITVVQNHLPRYGWKWTKDDCLPNKSSIARHCTIDFRNRRGVRLSVAVRNTFDEKPDHAYRIKCTQNCAGFRWSEAGL